MLTVTLAVCMGKRKKEKKKSSETTVKSSGFNYKMLEEKNKRCEEETKLCVWFVGPACPALYSEVRNDTHTHSIEQDLYSTLLIVTSHYYFHPGGKKKDKRRRRRRRRRRLISVDLIVLPG